MISASKFLRIKSPVIPILVLSLLVTSVAKSEDSGSSSQGAGMTSTAPLVTGPQNQDQKDSGNSSSAMAALGAAMAGVMCAMMMREAMKEKDPAKKRQLMMMALMQCAQAAASAAAAGQNKDNAKKNSSNNLPPPPTLTVAPTKIDTSPKEAALPEFGEQQPSEPLAIPDVAVPEVTVPELGGTPPEVAGGPGEPTYTPDFGPTFAGQGTGFSPLQPMDPKGLTAQESEKNSGTASPGSSPSPIGVGYNSGSKSSSSDIVTGKEGYLIDPASFRANNKGGGGAAEGGGGGDGGGSGEKENPDFQALLAQLMGGGPGAGGADMMGGSSEISFGTGIAKDGKPLNIFELGSLRYQQSFVEGNIETKAGKKQRLQKEKLAAAQLAQVSSHSTPGD